MYRPIQPQFKIRLFTGAGKQADNIRSAGVTTSANNNYIDIEMCVAYPVTYEETEKLISTLRFTVDSAADLLLYYFHIGLKVVLYGEYYSDERRTLRHVFTGTVTRIKTNFDDSGDVSFTVECMNRGFNKLGKNYKNFVYPDEDSDRKFARANSLSLGDLIKGIAKENDFEIGEINLSSKLKTVNFDKINVKYQKNMSDWKFLTKLAQDFGCNVYISTEDGVDKLNFVSNEIAQKKQSSDISFLFPLYSTDNSEIRGVRNYTTEAEMQRFSNSAYDRPRILRDVSVDEDVSHADISRSAVYFDKDTGEEKEAISRITEDKDGKMSVTFYELDEAKVQYVHTNMPEIADRIRENSPTSLPWGDPKKEDPNTASYYYKAVKYYEEGDLAMFDKAFAYGISVSAKCNQDLDIHSQRSYRIYGLLSYRSKNISSSYFLKGLRHIWDKDGTWTELEFKR